jgi:hypothetical protein
MPGCDGLHSGRCDFLDTVTAITWNRPSRAHFPDSAAKAREVHVTATLAAHTLASAGSTLVRRLKSGTRPETLYAPIDEHRTRASDSDVAAAWLAAGLAGLSLFAVLAL